MRFFQRKRKIYGVDSLTALKTWIFQDHQNIRKMNCWHKLSVHHIELINLLVPLQLSNSIYRDYNLFSFPEIHGHFIVMFEA